LSKNRRSYVAAFIGWLVAAATNFMLTKHLSLGINLLLGAFIQVLAHSLRVWAPPFPLFAVTFFLAGLGTGYQDSHSNTFVSEVNAAHRWLGVIHAMYGAGLLVSPFVATPVASAHMPSKWYLFYYFPLAIGICNLVLVLVAFRDSLRLAPPQPELATDAAPSRRSAFADAKATLRLKSVWLLSLFYFFYLGAALTGSGWVVEYLVTVRGATLKSAGFVPAGISGGVFLGRLLLAEPTHRFGERRMIFVYSMLALALQLVFWLVPNFIVAAVAVSLQAFLLGPLFPTGMAVGSKLFPRDKLGSALGLVFVLGQAGGALFPSLTGLVATAAGVQVLQPISVALLVLTGASWALVPKVEHRRD
jgi:fucose permease